MARFGMHAPSRFMSLWPISTREIRDFVACSTISMEIGVYYTCFTFVSIFSSYKYVFTCICKKFFIAIRVSSVLLTQND